MPFKFITWKLCWNGSDAGTVFCRDAQCSSLYVMPTGEMHLINRIVRAHMYDSMLGQFHAVPLIGICVVIYQELLGLGSGWVYCGWVWATCVIPPMPGQLVRSHALKGFIKRHTDAIIVACRMLSTFLPWQTHTLSFNACHQAQTLLS